MPNRLSLTIAGLFLASMILSGCGPSPEQIATPTQTALPPTPTPERIRYDLHVVVTDIEGRPIAGSYVTIAELAGNPTATIQTDDAGSVTWYFLPGESATISADAQGYLQAEISEIMERGSNELIVTLERDPYELLPPDVCAPGESLLYMEDFQDGQDQHWRREDSIAGGFSAEGWSIGPDDPGNLVLMASGQVSMRSTFQPEGEASFDNAVLRIRVKLTAADADMSLLWHEGATHDDHWVYRIRFGSRTPVTLWRHMVLDPGHPTSRETDLLLEEDMWYDFEVSTYEGFIEVWINGARMITYQDPQPLPPGTIGIDIHRFEGSTAAYSFDNPVVCELSAPFSSIFAPE